MGQIRLKGKLRTYAQNGDRVTKQRFSLATCFFPIWQVQTLPRKRKYSGPSFRWDPLCTHPSIYIFEPFSVHLSPASLSSNFVLHPDAPTSPKMFQVASAQPHNFAAGPVQQSQQQVPAKSLPRRLARPEFKQPNPKIIAAVNPELANVPIEYIRRGLADMGTE